MYKCLEFSEMLQIWLATGEEYLFGWHLVCIST
jgi:hypothetical protein